MAKLAKITVDWLRKGLEVDDDIILQRLVAEHMPWYGGGLDEQLFEQTYNLSQLPEEQFSPRHFDAIGLGLVNSEITEWNPKIEPDGNRLSEQIRSVLPQSMTRIVCDSVSYAVGRILLDDVPVQIMTDIPPQGLDRLSASLMSLHHIARTVDQSVPVLFAIWRMSIIDLKLQKLRGIKGTLRETSDIDEIIYTLDRLKDDIQEVVKSPDDPLLRKFSSWRSKLNAFNEAIADELESLNRRIREVSDDKDEVSTKRLREERRERKLVNEESLRDRVLDLTDRVEEEIRLQSEKLALSARKTLSVRPDALTESTSRLFSQAIRESMNILNCRSLIDVSRITAHTNTLAAPSVSDIQKELNVEHWRAKEISKQIRNLITERFLTSYKTVNLKLRYILTPLVKQRISSLGLLESLVLGRCTYHSESVGFEPGLGSVHIEPIRSNGPSRHKIATELFAIEVNAELFSFRPDLYDQTQGSWKIEPWHDTKQSHEEEPSWLLKETKADPMSTTLTPRNVDVLGPLMGLESRNKERLWILKALGIPQRTISDSTKKLIESEVVRPIHHPLLDFCGLPESILVFMAGVEQEQLHTFIGWLTTVFPYVRIRHDKSKGNLVAELRTPQFGLTRVEEHLNNWAQSLDGKVAIGKLADVPHSYYLTVLHRLYDQKDQIWLEPWI